MGNLHSYHRSRSGLSREFPALAHSPRAFHIMSCFSLLSHLNSFTKSVLKGLFIILCYGCATICFCVPHACRKPQRSEEDVRCPETGVTYVCELPCVAGTEPGSSASSKCSWPWTYVSSSHFVFFCFLRLGFMYPRMVLNSWSSCLPLLSAGITGMYVCHCPYMDFSKTMYNI